MIFREKNMCDLFSLQTMRSIYHSISGVGRALIWHSGYRPYTLYFVWISYTECLGVSSSLINSIADTTGNWKCIPNTILIGDDLTQNDVFETTNHVPKPNSLLILPAGGADFGSTYGHAGFFFVPSKLNRLISN